jgi:hypothetical protein
MKNEKIQRTRFDSRRYQRHGSRRYNNAEHLISTMMVNAGKNK